MPKHKQKSSFVLHHDSLKILEELDKGQRGELFMAIYNFQIGEEIGTLSQVVKIVFINFKNQFERDNKKYLAACETNRLNALKKYNRPDDSEDSEPEPLAPNGRDPQPIAPSGSQSHPMAENGKKNVPIPSDSDSESKSDTKVPKTEESESELPLAVSPQKNTASEKKFLELFNRLKKEKFPKTTGHVGLDKKEKNDLKRILDRNISFPTIEKCIVKMLSTKWVVDSGNHTPKHILIDANFNRYLNQVETDQDDQKPSDEQQLIEE